MVYSLISFQITRKREVCETAVQRCDYLPIFASIIMWH
jgi:hypothetical protein